MENLMKIHKLIFILLFLTALILTACNPALQAAESDTSWIKHESQALGISFELPGSWVTKEAPDVLTMANTQESLDAEKIGIGAGASITPASAADFQGINDPIKVIDVFVEFFQSSSPDIQMIQEPTEMIIQGQPAANVIFQGAVREQEGVFTTVIIAKDDDLILVLTVDGSEGGVYTETLNRFMDSVEFLD
jgi:hypothetical protein